RTVPAAAHPCLRPRRASGTCRRRSPHRQRPTDETIPLPIPVRLHWSGTVTDAIALAGSLTLPVEGLALELELGSQVASSPTRELRGRRRGPEAVRRHPARRPRCCRPL